MNKKLILGALAVVGAWCVQADAIPYRDPVFAGAVNASAVTGYTTATANAHPLVSGFDNPVTLTSGWYYIYSQSIFNKPLTIDGDVKIILWNECAFSSLHAKQGIIVKKGSTLTIYESGGGYPALITAKGRSVGYGAFKDIVRGAGIGDSGEDGATCGRIVINGGEITATGAGGNAFIHGGSGIGVRGGNCSQGIVINGGTITANGAAMDAGIGATDAITINGGTIDATGGWGDEFGGGGAGIGSCHNAGTPKITINGGTVTATGGYDAAGIGSGEASGSFSTITINGGTVTAKGSHGGAGIGGGRDAASGEIVITGGKVTASGHTTGAGIGYGERSGGEITITGGEVTATGADHAAGIGGSKSTAGDNITISGGKVTATGGEYAAGIGGGACGSGDNITISGGWIHARGGEKGGAGIGGGVDGSGNNITISGGYVEAIAGGSILPDDEAHIKDYKSSWGVSGTKYTRGMDIGAGGYHNKKIPGGVLAKVVKHIDDDDPITKALSAEVKIIDEILKKDEEKLLSGITAENLLFTGGTVEALMVGGAKEVKDNKRGTIKGTEPASVTITGGSVHTLAFSTAPVDASGNNIDLLVFRDATTSPADLQFLDSPHYGTTNLYPNGNSKEVPSRLFLWPVVDNTTAKSGTTYYTNGMNIKLNGDPRLMTVTGEKDWTADGVKERRFFYTLSYGIKVGGEWVTDGDGSGKGWSCANGVLTLSEAKAYTLTGTDTTGKLRVVVTANANVTLNNVTLSTTNAVTLFKFTSGATDATLTLKGANKIYSGSNAFLVEAPGSKVTVREDSQGGCLVGSGDAATGRRFCHNNGILVLKSGTIKDYRPPTGWAGGAIYNSGTFTMDGGTISGCQTADYGGAVYNAGTFAMNGGTISGNKADFGGALYNDGTAKIYGGTFADCIARSQGSYITSKNGTCDIYGGYFEPASGTIFDCLSQNFKVYGGVTKDFATGFYINGRMKLSGSDLTVYGQDMTQANGQLTGGTYTFNPTNADYAAAGVKVMGNCTVTPHEEATPKTYVVHVDAEFRVNGALLSTGSGTGWTFEQIDGNTGRLTLNSAMDYTLSGYCNAGLKVDVTANAKVSMTDVRIHADNLMSAVFNVTAPDAHFALGGTNEIYATNGVAAISVASGAKLTLDGDGTLVGGKAADKTCLGVSVDGGTFVMNGGTISGYKGGSYGGGLYFRDSVAELNAGTITDCSAHFGGALALWNSGTVNIRNGMMISGNSALSHGAVFLQGGTINVWGGTFRNNTVYTGVLADWAGTLNVYGGVFQDNSIKPVHREDGSVVAVSGGVYDVTPEEIVRGYAATKVGDNHVVGQGVTQEENKLTGGTYTFDPSRAEYAAAGLAIAKQHTVETQGTDPETYRVHVAADFTVNNVRLEDGTGEGGWLFAQDGTNGKLTLMTPAHFTLEGYSDLTLLVDVLSNATVTLNGVRIRAGAAGRDVFSVTAEDATFVLSGTNEVYATDGHAAIGVGPFAKLTVTGDGALVGGKTADATCLGVSVNSGTFVMNGGTISGYKGGSYGGGLYFRDSVAELNAGTITDCSAHFGGALALWNSGTVNIRNGMTISGNSALSHGAVFLQGGAINVWGGTFMDNTVATGVLVDWMGTLNVYGGVFGSNPIKPVYQAMVYGGVYDQQPEGIVSDRAATRVGDLYVIGQGVTQEENKLTGGTYTFDPTDALYADVGLVVAEEHVVFAQTTAPATYVVDWNWTDFTVNGEDLVLGSGTAWTYDKVTGLLSLDAGNDYILSGALSRKDLGLGVAVDAAVTVILSNATITSSAVSPLTVNAAGVTVQLAGENQLTAPANCAAIAVPSGKSVTITCATGDDKAGRLVASGGSNAAAIGGKGSVTIAGGVIDAQGGIAGGNVTITNGTVSAQGAKGETDIAGNVRILGGSVKAIKVTDPKNANGDDLWCVTVPFAGWSGKVGAVVQDYDYGGTNLYLVGQGLYLWLPNKSGEYRMAVTYNAETAFEEYYAKVAGAPTVAYQKTIDLTINDMSITNRSDVGWVWDNYDVLRLSGTTNYVISGQATTGAVTIVVEGSCSVTVDCLQLGSEDLSSTGDPADGKRHLLYVGENVTVDLTVTGTCSYQTNDGIAPIGVGEGAMLVLDGRSTLYNWDVKLYGAGATAGCVMAENPQAITFMTEESAETAAQQIKPMADETVFPDINQKAYGSLFAGIARTTGSGTWKIGYNLTAEAEQQVEEGISTVAVLSNLVESIVGGGKPTTTFTPVPGIYYGLAGDTDVTDMDAANVPQWYPGQQGGDLTVEGEVYDEGKAFYQLKATATPER